MSPGFIEQEVVVNAGRTSTVEVRVRPMAAVIGIVENVSADSLLKGVKVRLHDANGKLLQESVTGDDGMFRFTSLPAGGYHVTAVLPKGYVIEGDAERLVEVTGGGEVRCDFRVHRHGNIEGRVVTDDGHPVGEAEVDLVDSTGSVVRTSRTDADGHYSFKDVPVDKYRVRVVVPEK